MRFRMTFQSVVEPARPPHGVKDPVKDWGRREVSLPFAGGEQNVTNDFFCPFLVAKLLD